MSVSNESAMGDLKASQEVVGTNLGLGRYESEREREIWVWVHLIRDLAQNLERVIVESDSQKKKKKSIVFLKLAQRLFRGWVKLSIEEFKLELYSL